MANKTGPTRLGFAPLLKFFELEAGFPRGPEEVPPAAVTYVAGQVGVPAEDFARYSWAPTARSIKAHRVQIRQAFGFREFTRGDEDKLSAWLAEEVCPVELRDEACTRSCWSGVGANGSSRLAGPSGSLGLPARCPSWASVSRRWPGSVRTGCGRLEGLLDEDGRSGQGLLAELKADPGHGGPGDAVARGRQARRGAGPGATRRPVRRSVRADGGGLAGPGCPVVPPRRALDHGSEVGVHQHGPQQKQVVDAGRAALQPGHAVGRGSVARG